MEWGSHTHAGRSVHRSVDRSIGPLNGRVKRPHRARRRRPYPSRLSTHTTPVHPITKRRRRPRSRPPPQLPTPSPRLRPRADGGAGWGQGGAGRGGAGGYQAGGVADGGEAAGGGRRRWVRWWGWMWMWVAFVDSWLIGGLNDRFIYFEMITKIRGRLRSLPSGGGRRGRGGARAGGVGGG